MRVRRRRRRNLTRVYILAVILVVIATGIVAANWFGSRGKYRGSIRDSEVRGLSAHYGYGCGSP